MEYERVKEAYINMTQSLEASAAEKRALEVRLGQAATDAAREAREHRYVQYSVVGRRVLKYSIVGRRVLDEVCLKRSA